MARNYVEETPSVHSTSTGRPSAISARTAAPLLPPNKAPLRTAISLPPLDQPPAIVQSNKRWAILRHCTQIPKKREKEKKIYCLAYENYEYIKYLGWLDNFGLSNNAILNDPKTCFAILMIHICQIIMIIILCNWKMEGVKG